MKNYFARIAVILVAISTLTSGNVAYAAGNASFSVSATPSSLTVGSNTTVSLYENGTDVNVVTATFTFDSNKLQFVNGSCAGSFSNQISVNDSSVSCYVAPGTTVSGSQKFANLVFKSIATGSTTVTVTGSQIASGGSNIWNNTSSSTTIAINPAATPTPTPVITVTPTVKPTATPVKTSPTPTKTATPTPTPTPTNNGGQVAGATITPTPTPSATATPSATPTTQTKPHSRLPWAAGSVFVIIAATAGIYYWFFRNR